MPLAVSSPVVCGRVGRRRAPSAFDASRFRERSEQDPAGIERSGLVGERAEGCAAAGVLLLRLFGQRRCLMLQRCVICAAFRVATDGLIAYTLIGDEKDAVLSDKTLAKALKLC